MEESFEVIGFSVFGSNRKSTYYTLKTIRNKFTKSHILFGGPSAADIFWPSGKPGPAIKYWLTDNDACIIGESEKAMPDLLKWWSKEIKEQPGGVVTQKNDITKYQPSSPYDFSHQHISVDYSDFKLELYSEPVIPIEISRGCIGKCAFCTEKNLHCGYRTQSIDLLIDTFKRCIEKYDIHYFSFIGSAVNGNFMYFKKLLSHILKSGLKFLWGCSIRLDKRFDSTIISDMARAGCDYVNTGLESAAPAILHKMNKYIDIPIAERIIRDLNEVGIDVAINIIAGFPGETEDDHQHTIDFIRRNGKYIKKVHVSPCQIFEGSQLCNFPELYGISSSKNNDCDNWVTIDGKNTNSIRQRRVQEMINVLNDTATEWLTPFKTIQVR